MVKRLAPSNLARGIALVVLGGCGAHDVLGDLFGPGGRTIREEIAAFPPEVQDGFHLMEKRCTKCHTLNEPFSAHIPKGGWRSQVRKMERKPAAAIPPDEADRIAAFMEYFSERRREAKAE